MAANGLGGDSGLELNGLKTGICSTMILTEQQTLEDSHRMSACTDCDWSVLLPRASLNFSDVL